MKKKKQNNKGFLIFIALFVITILVALLVKVFYVPTKTYHSKFLNITIDYPAKFQLEERFGEITLKNNKGEILIYRTGTNYNSLHEYIADLDVRYKQSEKIRSYRIINSLKGIESVEEYSFNPDLNNKSYSFYINHWIYGISTKAKELYSDLDRIAESFRYAP